MLFRLMPVLILQSLFQGSVRKAASRFVRRAVFNHFQVPCRKCLSLNIWEKFCCPEVGIFRIRRSTQVEFHSLLFPFSSSHCSVGLACQQEVLVLLARGRIPYARGMRLRAWQTMFVCPGTLSLQLRFKSHRVVGKVAIIGACRRYRSVVQCCIFSWSKFSIVSNPIRIPDSCGFWTCENRGPKKLGTSNAHT